MISRVMALTQRELATTFLSPVAYIVAAVFLVASGWLFMDNTLIDGGEASMRFMLDSMAWLLIFAVPMLTMRLISDEFASGTIETLMTAPVTDAEVVLGKFIGVFMFFVALLATTVLHIVLLSQYGQQDVNALLYGYLGMILLGGLYISVGLFASAMTRHQLLAAIIGVAVLALLTILVDTLAALQGGQWRVVLSHVNVLYHFHNFSRGIFDTKDLVFFVSGTALFLFLTIKVLESRRWR
ncbi:MAG: ABC transporter permease subunit [Planctomycetes bacterium]|nr:ABC transporter permease subunit [Planctomycetota bacterium]